MTATDDRVWSEFGLETPERIAAYRAQELAGADPCRCQHLRREHFPDRCAHTTVRYTPAAYGLPCPCKGFSAVQTPGEGEDV